MNNVISQVPPYRSLPSEKTPAYVDPFRKIHDRNIEMIKKRHLKEKRQLLEELQEKRSNEIREEKINTANAIERYRLLNII